VNINDYNEAEEEAKIASNRKKYKKDTSCGASLQKLKKPY
jgi:hypothetical protein